MSVRLYYCIVYLDLILITLGIFIFAYSLFCWDKTYLEYGSESEV